MITVFRNRNPLIGFKISIRKFLVLFLVLGLGAENGEFGFNC